MLFGFLKPKPKFPDFDRRRELRYEAEDEFILEFKERNSRYVGSSRDISIHGVRFATTCKLRAGKTLILNFRFPAEFPGERQVSVKAKVVRAYKPQGTERYRVACRLHHEEEKTKEVIRQFIFWLESKPKK